MRKVYSVITLSTVIPLILAALSTPVLCVDIDLRSLLSSAAVRLAAAAGTRIRRDKLSQGLCFSAEDGGPSSGCQEQTSGATIYSFLRIGPSITPCFPHARSAGTFLNFQLNSKILNAVRDMILLVSKKALAKLMPFRLWLVRCRASFAKLWSIWCLLQSRNKWTKRTDHPSYCPSTRIWSAQIYQHRLQLFQLLDFCYFDWPGSIYKTSVY